MDVMRDNYHSRQFSRRFHNKILNGWYGAPVMGSFYTVLKPLKPLKPYGADLSRASNRIKPGGQKTMGSRCSLPV